MTAAAHRPSTGDTTYDGGTNAGTTDTITMVMAPWRLEDVLSTAGATLATYMDGDVAGASLNLGGTAWNAQVTNF